MKETKAKRFTLTLTTMVYDWGPNLTAALVYMTLSPLHLAGLTGARRNHGIRK
jgi:hypothetical protein